MKARDNSIPCNLVVIEGNGTRKSHQGDGYKESDIMYTLNTVERHAVAYQEKVNALCASDSKQVGNQYVGDSKCIVEEECSEPCSDPVYRVRRLTPKECERLQGFPDNWTDIGEWTDSKGKRRITADSARYKALGNSIALPFWKWLIEGISRQYDEPPTMGSLFDGISGFPLCWARTNGEKTCIWSSEIEEFPVAVIKQHFGDGQNKGDLENYLDGESVNVS